jgi:myo-inositol 2-dehydrogenase/D-chiro-inositol 1-dehydrogenase
MVVPIRKDAADTRALLTDWKLRFIDAYDVELKAFLDSVREGHITAGASAWDGYAAAVAADACIRSQTSLREELVTMPPMPVFYGK